MRVLVACEYSGIASAMADQWGDLSRLPVPVEQLCLF